MKNLFRWLALVLLFLNVAYCAWSLASLEYANEKPAAADVSQLNSLILLNEVANAKGDLKARGQYIENLEGASSGKQDLEAGRDQQAAPVQVYTSEPYCPSIGPITKKQQADLLLEEMLKKGISASLKTVYAEPVSQFRVYLPPFESHDQALLELTKLRLKKIDSFLISDGEMKHAISLGVFQSRESAEGLVRKLKSSYYAAKIKQFSSQQSTFWIDLDHTAKLENLEKAVLNAMKQIKGATRIDYPCKAIALRQ